MLRNVMFVAALAAISAPAIPSMTTAQSVASLPAQGTAAKRTPVRVTLDLQNVPLDEALRAIAAQANLEIVRQVSGLSLNQLVFLSVREVTPSTALELVTRGAPVRATITSNGNTIVVRRAEPASAKAQGVITGKITDSKSGRGIMGVSVTVDASSHGTVTSEDGMYRLNNVSAGTHAVSAKLVGYAKQTRSISVGEGATVTVDFKLEPSASVLDQVIVTGTVVSTELKAVPNAITVVTAKQLEDRGITRIDQLFRGDIPGLFAANVGSRAPLDSVMMFSRGYTSFVNGTTTPIKTYVDGVELSNPSYLSQIDPRSIERIEILTGPQASTIYGSNAINGVMQIFTKRGASPRPDVKLVLVEGFVENNFSKALTPQHDYNGQVSGVEGKISYNAGGSWNSIGAWTPAKATDRSNTFIGARTQSKPLTVDGNWRVSDTRNKSRGSSNEVLTVGRSTGVFTGNASNGVTAPGRYSMRTQTMGLTLQYAPMEWWSHELVFGNDVSQREQFNTAPARTNQVDTAQFVTSGQSAYRSMRYTTTSKTPLGSLAQLVLTVGADGVQTKSTAYSAFGLNKITGSLNGSSVSVTREPGHNTGGFVQGQLAVRDALFFTYGLRAEWNPNYGEEAQPNLAPRYGVAYTIDLGPVTTKLRGSYGRSTRPPTNGQKAAEPEDRSTVVPYYPVFNRGLANNDLGPESQQGGEGGVEIYLGNRGSLIVTRYNQTVDNLIARPYIDSIRSLAPSPGFWDSRDADNYGYVRQYMYLNSGTIRNQGWELQGSVNTGPFTTRGTYSWTKSRVLGLTPAYRNLAQSIPGNYQPGAPFDYLPEHTWATQVTYARRATTVSLNVNGTGFLYRQQDQLSLDVGSMRLTTQKPRSNLSNYHSIGAGYVMADLNMSHRASEKIETTLQVLNLSDLYRNDYSVSFASIGRQTRAGVRLRF